MICSHLPGIAMEENQEGVSNPVVSDQSLKLEPTSSSAADERPVPQSPLAEDSAVTKAEKIEWHGTTDSDEPSSKRVKLEPSGDFELQEEAPARSKRQKGVTPIKAESVAFQQIPELQAHGESDSFCMLLVVARAKEPRRQMSSLPKDPAVLSAPLIIEISRIEESQKVRILTATSVLQRTRLAYAKVALMRRNSLQTSVDLAMGVNLSMIYEST